MKILYKSKRNFPFMKNTWQRTLRFYRQVIYDQFFGILRTVGVCQTGSLVCENRGYVSNPVLWSLRTLVVVDVVYPTGSLLLENPGWCCCCVPGRFFGYWEPSLYVHPVKFGRILGWGLNRFFEFPEHIVWPPFWLLRLIFSPCPRQFVKTKFYKWAAPILVDCP